MYYNLMMRSCNICGKPVNRKSSNGSEGGRGWRCNTCIVSLHRYRQKKRAVELLGGKCCRCSWSGSIAALQFHHKRGKTTDITRILHRSWERVSKELKKCELLCANCHAVEHANQNPKFHEAVNSPRKSNHWKARAAH